MLIEANLQNSFCRWWCSPLQIWREISPILKFSRVPMHYIQILWWVITYYQLWMNHGSVKAFASLFVLSFFCSLGHYTVPREMDEVSNWLRTGLGLEGAWGVLINNISVRPEYLIGVWNNNCEGGDGHEQVARSWNGSRLNRIWCGRISFLGPFCQVAKK